MNRNLPDSMCLTCITLYGFISIICVHGCLFNYIAEFLWSHGWVLLIYSSSLYVHRIHIAPCLYKLGSFALFSFVFVSLLTTANNNYYYCCSVNLYDKTSWGWNQCNCRGTKKKISMIFFCLNTCCWIASSSLLCHCQLVFSLAVKIDSPDMSKA